MKRDVRMIVSVLAVGMILLPGFVLAEIRPEERALLADTNLFSTVPEKLHARVTITQGSGARPLRVEAWRGGRDKLLVRTLDAKQAGRFLLQLGNERYLIAPGAEKPVKLGAAVAMAGAMSLEQLLGIDVEKDFTVERVDATDQVVTFHLKAKPGTEASKTTPGARWVVDRKRRLPLRVDIILADGRTARVIEFTSFKDGRRGVPSRLVLKDVLRGGAPVTVDVEVMDSMPIPDGLFSLTDGSFRGKLPPIETNP